MFALLCEVALGKMKTTKVGGDSLNASDVEYNSVVGVGREIPDSAFDVTLPYGKYKQFALVITAHFCRELSHIGS